MKQTKFVVNVVLVVVSLLLYFISAASIYSIMRVTRFNFACIIIATILLTYRKELVYLLTGRKGKKAHKDNKVCDSSVSKNEPDS